MAPIDFTELAQAYAFIGNSLLTPMTRTSAVGLDPAFWQAFPTFDDAGIEQAVDGCEAFAQRAQGRMAADTNMARECAIEHTRLFVGPPRPAAAPWETMYNLPEGADEPVGFGAATFAMRRLLAEAGLELSNENNQYEDHLGIELLYLSVLCERAVDTADDASRWRDAQAPFIEEHPLSWVGELHERIAAEEPNGYFSPLTALARALLTWHLGQLRA